MKDSMVPVIAWIAVIVLVLLFLHGCAPLQPPRPPPEPALKLDTVPVPYPVPCFDEKDRPIAPQPTPIDLDNATVDQKAAALAADDAADDQYMRDLEALFVQCMKSTGKVVK